VTHPQACSQQVGSGTAARAVFAPQLEDAAVQLHVGLALHAGSATQTAGAQQPASSAALRRVAAAVAS